jgi:hypothetical protein
LKFSFSENAWALLAQVPILLHYTRWVN